MDDDLIRRTDANLLHCHSVFAAATPRGDVAQWGGLLIKSMGVQMVPFNTAFVTRPLDDAAKEIKAAISFFDDRGLPFSIRMRDGIDPNVEEACVAQGLVVSETEPGMVLAPIPKVPVDRAGLEIRRASFEVGYDDFVRTMASGSGVPLEAAYNFVSPDVLDALWVEFFTGYLDGAPVATSTLVVSHRVAGVYNVATLEGHRRKGYGRAMTWHAIARGVELRADMASLQASEMGEPLYEEMGFRTVCSYTDYARPEN